MPVKLTRSARGAFEDLGFAPEEAAHLRIRSELMIAIRKIIVARRLTQVEAARLFGVTQPRISNLVRGRIELFSIDSLVEMLAAAGTTVRVTVAKTPKVA